MKDNEMELNGLIEEVLAQIREQKYGQKIYSHYQYSFSGFSYELWRKMSRKGTNTQETLHQRQYSKSAPRRNPCMWLPRRILKLHLLYIYLRKAPASR